MAWFVFSNETNSVSSLKTYYFRRVFSQKDITNTNNKNNYAEIIIPNCHFQINLKQVLVKLTAMFWSPCGLVTSLSLFLNTEHSVSFIVPINMCWWSQRRIKRENTRTGQHMKEIVLIFLNYKTEHWLEICFKWKDFFYWTDKSFWFISEMRNFHCFKLWESQANQGHNI